MITTDLEYQASLKKRLMDILHKIKQLQREELLLKRLIGLMEDSLSEVVKVDKGQVDQELIKNDKVPPISSVGDLKVDTFLKSVSEKKVSTPSVPSAASIKHELIIGVAVRLLHNRDWTSAKEVLDSLPRDHGCAMSDVSGAFAQELFKSKPRIKRISRGMYGKVE